MATAALRLADVPPQLDKLHVIARPPHVVEGAAAVPQDSGESLAKAGGKYLGLNFMLANPFGQPKRATLSEVRRLTLSERIGLKPADCPSTEDASLPLLRSFRTETRN